MSGSRWSAKARSSPLEGRAASPGAGGASGPQSSTSPSGRDMNMVPPLASAALEEKEGLRVGRWAHAA